MQIVSKSTLTPHVKNVFTKLDLVRSPMLQVVGITIGVRHTFICSNHNLVNWFHCWLQHRVVRQP